MKHPTGIAKPRRLAAPKTAPKKRKVRLDLKRSPEPEPEDGTVLEQKSNFWKWVALVALLHVLVIGIAYFIYESAPAAKPPEQFISLLPPGDVVKGTAGAQQAHKVGPTTAAPAHHASTPPPPPVAAAPPKPVTPPPVVIPPPKPALVAQDKPIIKPPPKPTPPKPTPPKVKVDLTLTDGPTPPVDKEKPKPHHKKPVVKPTEDKNQDDTAHAESAGLSKEQIAAKLGEKLDAAGVKNATKSGTSGSSNTNQNQFSEFYQMIAEQIKDNWEGPNFADQSALSPIVQIHVEKDGRVPPESVHLTQSSGNPSYDDSSVEAAKKLGYLHEPLPDGCSPDISIHIHPY